MNPLPENLKQHTAKCTHIWPIAFRVPNALKATNSTPNKREKGVTPSGKHLFKSIKAAPTTQRPTPAQPVKASKAPTKPTVQPKSP
jgi:hypothetical protein